MSRGSTKRQDARPRLWARIPYTFVIPRKGGDATPAHHRRSATASEEARHHVSPWLVAVVIIVVLLVEAIGLDWAPR